MFSLRSRPSPIGVAIDGDAVRLLQVDWRGEQGRVIASSEIEIERRTTDSILTPDLAARIQRTLKTGGFRGHRAVVALPSDHVVERHVKVDVAEGQALRDALLFELEPSFPGDAPIVQHLEVGEIVERGERRNELIVLAAGLKPVTRLLEFLESADLEPIALDAEACALIRCFMQRRRRTADAEHQTAIVHIGHSATQMAITAAGHPMFMKQLPLGAGQFFEVISQRLSLSRDEVRVDPGSDPDAENELASHVLGALRLQLDSLTLELSACLRYHAASRRSGSGLEIFLTGPGAEIPGVAAALSDSLSQPVSRPDPFCPAFSGVPADKRTGAHYSVWSVTLGLALREVAA